MYCGECGTPLDRPGDYCLVCRTANCDGTVVDCARDRARITVLDGTDRVGETTVTTTPETAGELAAVELRNFAGRIADEVRRKRPETVYAAGERPVVEELRAELHHEIRRVPDEQPVETVVERRGERPLAVVETPASEKLGGSHTTLVGGRDGREAIRTVAGHPHVKKVIPGPIETGGASGGGVRAKVTRAGENGNVRLLLRDGSSVQENRIVTTAMDRDTGERVRDDLAEALSDTGLSADG